MDVDVPIRRYMARRGVLWIYLCGVCWKMGITPISGIIISPQLTGKCLNTPISYGLMVMSEDFVLLFQI